MQAAEVEGGRALKLTSERVERGAHLHVVWRQVPTACHRGETSPNGHRLACRCKCVCVCVCVHLIEILKRVA